jgi:hypothetical protein
MNQSCMVTDAEPLKFPGIGVCRLLPCSGSSGLSCCVIQIYLVTCSLEANYSHGRAITIILQLAQTSVIILLSSLPLSRAVVFVPLPLLSSLWHHPSRHPFAVAHIFALSPCFPSVHQSSPLFSPCHCHSRRVKSPSSSLPRA